MRNIRQLLSFLAGELAQSHGQRFFAQLCEALGIYLHARGVFITEWIGPDSNRQARTLACWLDGQQVDSFTYPLAGTPCYEARPGKVCVYRKGVKELFPDDPDVHRLDVESYVGVAFTDSLGRILGHLGLFDSRVRPFPAEELDAMRIAAVRAGAEVLRIASQRNLEESEQRYQAIVNKSSEAILVWRDGRVLDCNETALQMFACGREQLIGKAPLDLSPSLQADGTPSAQRLEEIAAQVYDNSLEHNWRHHRFNGEIFDAEVVVQNVTIGGEPHFVSLSRDISRRLRSREALVRSERTLRATLDHSPVAMLLCGADGEIEMANHKFETLFGYSQQDLPTLDHWWPLAFPDIELERRIRCEWYQRLTERQIGLYTESRPIEAKIACRDGSSRIVQIKCAPVGEKRLATFLDITEQQRALDLAEQARHAAENANQSKDQFLAALSHELRTPLTPVLLAATHLQSLSTLVPEARCLVDVIRRNAEMEARLIDDLLDLARITNGKLEMHSQPANVHDVIQAAIQICWSDISARQLQVVQELDASHPFANADSARLQQVFWNLLKNAVKFTPPGGKITLRSRCEAPANIHIASPHLLVEVIDTGVGMSADTCKSLFTAFQQGSREITRQFGGLGLGLCITKSIVTLHGGEIEAFSDGPNTGSRFVVRLPTCAAPPAGRIEPDAPVVAAPERPARILLVEDHRSTGQLLKGMLERFGHQIVWAQSRAQAEQVLDTDKNFDLLLSDLGLPDGTGLEIMPLFHACTGRPGIALSGYGMDQDVRNTREAGFSLHLIKPVDLPRLRDAVSRLATGPTMGGGLRPVSRRSDPACATL